MAREQIGTVRVTRTRVYKLDPQAPDLAVVTQVLVEPGEYPVYRDGDTCYWRMTGVINHNHYRLGDGAFAVSSDGSDVPSDDDVVFYSWRYGPDEWADLMTECAEAKDPRLVFTIWKSDDQG